MRSSKLCTIVMLTMFCMLLILNKDTVHAEEQNTEEVTEDKTTSKIWPLRQSIIMCKEQKTALLPIYAERGVTVSSIQTNQDNFIAEYKDGVIQLTAVNTDDYMDHEIVQLNLKLEYNDVELQQYEDEISVMLEIESDDYLKEELQQQIDIDDSEMNSFNRTLHLNAIDRRKILLSDVDFSDCKIVCIGDSITEGVGLSESDEAFYSYPADLQYILNAESVINLGKGGTSIASYWDSFLSIAEGIPEDTDVIIVMGGVNDCYSGNRNNMGNQTNLETGTFYGDTNFLMQDLKARYPDSTILFVTPFPTVTTTSYLSFLPDMLPLSVYAAVIKELGEKNDIPVYDIYSEDFLNSSDENVLYQFMYDGVHPNAKGYYILAEHIAGKLIDMEIADEN